MPELEHDILISELVIDGFRGDPSIISSIVGIDPTSQWRRGDAYRPGGGRYHRTNGWILRSSHSQDTSYIKQLDDILAFLVPRADSFANLPWDASWSIGCIGTVSRHRSIELSAEHVESIARLRSAFHIDIFVLDRPKAQLSQSGHSKSTLISKLVLSADITKPSKLTALLDIGPSTTWEDGCHPASLPTRLRSRNGWVYDSWATAERGSLSPHLESLIAMFGSRANELRSLPDDVRVNVWSHGHSVDARPVLSYSLEAIKMLGRWGAGIIHDVIDCS